MALYFIYFIISDHSNWTSVANLVRPLRLKLQSNGPQKVQFVGEVDEEEAVDQGGPKQLVGEVGEENAVDQGGSRRFVGEVGEEEAVDQGGPRQFVGEVDEEDAVDQGGPRQFVGEVGEDEAFDQDDPRREMFRLLLLLDMVANSGMLQGELNKSCTFTLSHSSHTLCRRKILFQWNVFFLVQNLFQYRDV